MNISKYLITAALLLISGLGFSAQAQFQGKIEMNLYTEDNGQTETNTLNMFVTDNRIKIQGEDVFTFGEGMNAEGLLIRNDHSDFVLMIGENRAIQVSKAEIESLVQMFSGMNGEMSNQQQPEEDDFSYRMTGETRTILGKECEQLIIEDNEEPNNYLSIWLTPKVEINWGMLAEPWKNIPQNMTVDFQETQNRLFKDKAFPLLIEAFEDGEATKIFEVTTIEESSVAKAMVEIPSGITLISARDYIFNMMMQQ